MTDEEFLAQFKAEIKHRHSIPRTLNNIKREQEKREDCPRGESRTTITRVIYGNVHRASHEEGLEMWR